MARLPQPGGDAGNWGEILNEYLSQTLDEGGALKNDTVGAPQLKSQSVTAASIANGNVTASKLAAGAATDNQVLTYNSGNLLWTTPSTGSGPITADQITETASNKILTAAERTKLAGITSGATANASDSQLRDRSTHTGSQMLSTISNVTASATEVNYTQGVTSAIQTQLNAKTNTSAILANGMGVVVHGATASTARPTGFAVVTWLGSAAPTNAVASDVWIYKAS